MKRGRHKKGKVFAKQMGLEVILKKLGYGSTQYYRFQNNCLRPKPGMFLSGVLLFVCFFPIWVCFFFFFFAHVGIEKEMQK